jgi:hypothetical protein
MSYIGKGLKSVSTVNITVDSMVGDGVTNTLELSQSNIESVIDVSVYYQGVAQVPDVDYTLINGSTVTFTSTPAAGIKIIAVTKADSFKDRVNDKSVVGESFADNAITNSKIIGLDASKLTGPLPAMDGSALTNKNLPNAPLESNVSNPTVTSNKTLGTVWVNTTTGNMFVLTDATTDQNIWINVGTGTGDVVYVAPWSYTGTIAGHITGGGNATGQADTDRIDKFSFASNVISIDKGNLTSEHSTILGRAMCTGHSSSTHGYTSGGVWSLTQWSNRIDKFSHASNNENAGLPGSALTDARGYSAGHSSETAGYNSGGYRAAGRSAVIDKFVFASDNTCVGIGNMILEKHDTSGTSSETHGYNSGGSGGASNIQKFSFSVNGDSSSLIASLTTGHSGAAGQSSSTHGYTSGGAGPSNVIERFSFASDSDVLDHGDLVVAKQGVAGHSSTTEGFASAGITAGYGTSESTSIHKFSFSSTATGSGHGDLSIKRFHPAAQQY